MTLTRGTFSCFDIPTGKKIENWVYSWPLLKRTGESSTRYFTLKSPEHYVTCWDVGLATKGFTACVADYVLFLESTTFVFDHIERKGGRGTLHR